MSLFFIATDNTLIFPNVARNKRVVKYRRPQPDMRRWAFNEKYMTLFNATSPSERQYGVQTIEI